MPKGSSYLWGVLGWIGKFEGLARYEILDLFYCTHNLLWKQDVCRSLGGGWCILNRFILLILPSLIFFCSASCYIKLFITSGNHIPGSRFYSDLRIPWQVPFASTSSYSSVVQSVKVLV